MRGRLTIKSAARAIVLAAAIALWGEVTAGAETLGDLVNEALAQSHGVLVREMKAEAARHAAVLAGRPPDPMIMLGYQNAGWEKYTYGEMPDAFRVYSLSQTFPYPGKLSLRAEAAGKGSEAEGAMYEAEKLRAALGVAELYYDLMLYHKSLSIVGERKRLFERSEEAALARYASGKGSRKDVLMAEEGKYMMLEKEEMYAGRINSAAAMMNALLGRPSGSPQVTPEDTQYVSADYDKDLLMARAIDNSPEIAALARALDSTDARVRLARREYYPDFAVSASVYDRGGGQEDMWMLSVSAGVPIFYRTKQRSALREAEAMRQGAVHELEDAKAMLTSKLIDNLSMLAATERSMDIYRAALSPKAREEFELAITEYTSGRSDMATLTGVLNSLLEYEISYVERETDALKARARINALAGLLPGMRHPEIESKIQAAATGSDVSSATAAVMPSNTVGDNKK